jgi:transposase
MSNKKAKYPKEFKLEAVKLVTEQGYTQAEAAKNLGISSKNLSRWVGEIVNPTQVTKSKTKLTADQEELQQLRKEVKRLKLEREILKKAAAFFANEPA